MSKPYHVMVVLEAKPQAAETLQQALEGVVEPSRLESTNLEYRLHRSVENPNQFILYEIWSSQAEHALQFEKPYIKELIEKTSGLLVQPYQVFFAEEIASRHEKVA